MVRGITQGTPAEGAAKLELELRRGVVVLAVLSRLRTAQYGYSLRKALEEKGMPIEEGTLYPLIRRLESQGLLASEWRIEGARPRRYYRLSEAGATLYAQMKTNWQQLGEVMNHLLAEEEG